MFGEFFQKKTFSRELITGPPTSKLLKQMVFGGQQESLVQSVSVPMPEAIQAIKQVEVVFSG